jgi:hypothetical protein
MTFACQFDNNLFALLLFEGICHSNSKNQSISLQRAKVGVGLQNRTQTTSRARSWSTEYNSYNERGSELVRNELTLLVPRPERSVML